MDTDERPAARTPHEPPPTIHMSAQGIAKLATALAAAQKDMRPAKKDATNPHFRSTYADLAAIRSACEPLAEHGLSVMQFPTRDGADVSVTTMLAHASGEWVTCTVSAQVPKQDAQAVGSAITYLRRYGLSAMVGMATEDDDGNAATGRIEPPARPAVAAKPAPATETERLTAICAALAQRLNARDKDKDAAKHFASAVTGKAKSSDYTLADWRRVHKALQFELDGDGEPDAEQVAS